MENKIKYLVTAEETTTKILYQEIEADSKEQAIEIAENNGYDWESDSMSNTSLGLVEIVAERVK